MSNSVSKKHWRHQSTWKYITFTVCLKKDGLSFVDKLDFSGPTRLDLRQEQIAELKQSGDYTWQEASNISADIFKYH